MKLPEVMTLEAVTQVAAELSDSAKTGSAIILDFSGACDIDLSGIQLLVALIKESCAGTSSVSFTGTIGKNFGERFTVCGFSAENIRTGEELMHMLEVMV